MALTRHNYKGYFSVSFCYIVGVGVIVDRVVLLACRFFSMVSFVEGDAAGVSCWLYYDIGRPTNRHICRGYVSASFCYVVGVRVIVDGVMLQACRCFLTTYLLDYSDELLTMGGGGKNTLARISDRVSLFSSSCSCEIWMRVGGILRMLPDSVHSSARGLPRMRWYIQNKSR